MPIYLWLLFWLLVSTLIHAAEAEKVQFNFVNAPLGLVLQQLNQSSRIHYELDKDINELVTMKQNGLSLEQAIEQLKKRYGLTEQKQEGNRVLLTRKAEQQPQTINRSKQQSSTGSIKNPTKQRSSLLMDIYSPRNVGAGELASLLDPRQGGILSSGSKVREEPLSNQLLVSASAAEHVQIRRILNKLDRPRKRVRVFSRIVIMRKQAKRELGARMGLRGVDGYTALAGGRSGAFLAPEQTNQFTNNLAVDFGSIGIGGNIALGYQDNRTLLELEFQALESSGLVDVVASPQVLVNSGQLAYIATGTQIPYLQQTAEGDADILFKDALLSLQVIPRVEAQDRINLSIQFSMDTVGSFYGSVPAIDTNKLDTNIIIPPGQTLVLGGIFSQIKSTNLDKVPVLGDIPILGRLFRHDVTNVEEAELLIFLTPELIYQ